MHQDNGRYYYSPTDLNEFLASPFATWMSRYALDSPGQAQPDPGPDPLSDPGPHGTGESVLPCDGGGKTLVAGHVLYPSVIRVAQRLLPGHFG